MRRRFRLADLPAEIAVRVVVHPVTGCWEWQHDDGPDPYSYGAVRWDGQKRPVYRVVYQMLVGPIPDGLVLDHVYARGCRARSCCWPAHLEPVTVSENSARACRATIIHGIRPFVLRRLGTGTANEAEQALAQEAWMLPFSLHPEPKPRQPVPRPLASAHYELPQAIAVVLPETVTPDTIWSSQRLARYFQITPERLERWRKKGYSLPPCRIDDDGTATYRWGDIDEWIDAQVELARSA